MPRPKDKNVIGKKWVFRKKLNENGGVKRNKERLVCKGYAQEGVDYFYSYGKTCRSQNSTYIFNLQGF